MIGAPNITRHPDGTYTAEAGQRTWRVTRATGPITIPRGRRRVPAKWVARNGRKAIYADTLPALGGRLRQLDGQLSMVH